MSKSGRKKEKMVDFTEFYPRILCILDSKDLCPELDLSPLKLEFERVKITNPTVLSRVTR